jgi:hypothetical protein
MPPISVLAASIVTCRTPWRGTSPTRFEAPSPTEKLNRNRDGSLLDFIDDFTLRFQTYLDEYHTLFDRHPHLEAT